MDVSKKQMSFKRLHLHIGTVRTKLWGWQTPYKNGMPLTVALDAVDVSQVSKAQATEGQGL